MAKFYVGAICSRVEVNFHMFKLDLEKAKGPEIKLPTTAG